MAYTLRREVLEFRETLTFTKQITALLTDDDYARLQGILALAPEAGDVIPDIGRSKTQVERAKPQQGKTWWHSSYLLLVLERFASLHAACLLERRA